MFGTPRQRQRRIRQQLQVGMRICQLLLTPIVVRHLSDTLHAYVSAETTGRKKWAPLAGRRSSRNLFYAQVDSCGIETRKQRIARLHSVTSGQTTPCCRRFNVGYGRNIAELTSGGTPQPTCWA